MDSARKLYWLAVLSSLAYSAYHGLFECSILYLVCIMMYNEGGGARNWILKSWLAAVGYCCYCWGTTKIFGEHPPHSLELFLTVVILQDMGSP